MADDLTLGRLLGRREAFNTMAARCSAAEAALLREMRDKRLYLSHANDWGEFCEQQLHTSRESANRVIKYLEEFGPTYFDVAQLTRISPVTYRAIAPSIRGQALHHQGEAIALIPENAEKVAVAVAEIRKAAPAPERPADDPLRVLPKLCGEVVAKFEEAVKLRNRPEQVRAELGYLRVRLDRIELTL